MHPHIKKTIIKLKSYNKPHTVIVGDINTLLSPLYKSIKQKINKGINEITVFFNIVSTVKLPVF